MKTEGAHAPEFYETRHPRLSGCCVYVVNEMCLQCKHMKRDDLEERAYAT